MIDHELRLDQPDDLLRDLKDVEDGQALALGVPVYVSAQDSRDVASSIREAIFICEGVADAFDKPKIEIEKDPNNPNYDLILLQGVVVDIDVVRTFVEEWRDVLDPDGSQEPFELVADTDDLYDRLESKEGIKSFRFPELVEWYREVRAYFDSWDPEE